MMRRTTALFLCLCVALSAGLVLTACGNDSSSSSSSSSSKKKKSSKKKSSSATGAGTVSLQNISFQPASSQVKVGGTVTWTNDESVGHDVTADDGSFKSGPPGGMKQGDKFEHKFDQAGNFAYKCTVHPNMTGTVEVSQ
jgi:plastocyanin